MQAYIKPLVRNVPVPDGIKPAPGVTVEEQLCFVMHMTTTFSVVERRNISRIFDKTFGPVTYKKG